MFSKEAISRQESTSIYLQLILLCCAPSDVHRKETLVSEIGWKGQYRLTDTGIRIRRGENSLADQLIH